MRTTLTLEDDIAEQIRGLVQHSGRSFKAVVNDLLRTGITGNRTATTGKPYLLKPTDLGGVVGSHNLDKALALSELMEDREIARKLDMRK